MIYPKHKRAWMLFFDIYNRFKMKFNFFQHRIIYDEMSFMHSHKSYLVVCNHTSWWDGFWVLRLNKLIFKKQFHVAMLESELRKNKFLSYNGAFSVPSSLSELRSFFQLGKSILDNKENMLLFFPQGEFASLYDQDIHFKNGVWQLLNQSQENVEVVFVGNFIDYYSHQKPTLSSYVELYKRSFSGLVDLQHAYQIFYDACLTHQINNKET